MQPVGGPVGRDVAAVAPDGADFHAAERLPDILAAADVTIGHHDGAVGVDDTSGKGRHLLIDASADPAQDGKRNYQYGGKANPQLLHVFPSDETVWKFQDIGSR